MQHVLNNALCHQGDSFIIGHRRCLQLSWCAHCFWYHTANMILAAGQLLSDIVVRCRRDSYTTPMMAGKLCGTSLPSTSLRMYRYIRAVCAAQQCIDNACCLKTYSLGIMPDFCLEFHIFLDKAAVFMHATPAQPATRLSTAAESLHLCQRCIMQCVFSSHDAPESCTSCIFVCTVHLKTYDRCQPPLMCSPGHA